MLSRANLLVLDEPTNHLDVESIEALEDAIQEYDGTVILVSHDRELLRALTTRIWVLHERRMTEFAGGFAEWEEVSTERAHAAAVRAAEDQALRQVHERQRVAAPDRTAQQTTPARRCAARNASSRRRRRAVAELESQVAPVVAALEDPALYTRPDGAATARRARRTARNAEAQSRRGARAVDAGYRAGRGARERLTPPTPPRIPPTTAAHQKHYDKQDE